MKRGTCSRQVRVRGHQGIGFRFDRVHAALKEPGCEPPLANSVFRIEPASSKVTEHGVLLGYFGKGDKASHVVVVNLDYRVEITATIAASADLEGFEASTSTWSSLKGQRAEVHLPPGGGKLLRLAQ